MQLKNIYTKETKKKRWIKRWKIKEIINFYQLLN